MQRLSQLSTAGNTDTSPCFLLLLGGLWAAFLIGPSATTLAGPLPCTPTLKWTFSLWGGDSWHMPLIVQLTDDNGDQQIDENDHADVVLSRGYLTAIDGPTGSLLFNSAGTVFEYGLAAGDIDGDGVVEIVGLAPPEPGGMFNRIAAYEHTGALKWFSPGQPFLGVEFPQLGIADLDQDGVPEIYIQNLVHSGSGQFLYRGAANSEGYVVLRYISNAVDLDPASPGLELLAGNALYGPLGVVLWRNTTVRDGLTAVADLTGDGTPEIVLVTLFQNGPAVIHVLDRAGTQVGTSLVLNDALGFVSSPMIADIDGDNLPEVVLEAGSDLIALDWSGTAFVTKWSIRFNDPTAILSSPSAFDFDGDGADEVLYTDTLGWYIVDGQSGAQLFGTSHNSGTGFETPIVTNLDDDCSPEIVISTPGGARDVKAFDCDALVEPRAVMNQLMYHGTNVNEDGTIPQFEAQPWTQQSGWLARHALGVCTCDAVAILRNDEISAPGQPPALAAIFTAACATDPSASLDAAAVSDCNVRIDGEGSRISGNGSDDADDVYLSGVSLSPGALTDPEPGGMVADINRPLMFWQLEGARDRNGLRITKQQPGNSVVLSMVCRP